MVGKVINFYWRIAWLVFTPIALVVRSKWEDGKGWYYGSAITMSLDKIESIDSKAPTLEECLFGEGF